MYISGESPATWVQEMPLLALGISSKAGRESDSSNAGSGVAPANDLSFAPKRVGVRALPNPDKPRSCSQRRREIIATSRWLRLDALWLPHRAADASPARRFPCARCDRRQSPADSG